MLPVPGTDVARFRDCGGSASLATRVAATVAVPVPVTGVMVPLSESGEGEGCSINIVERELQIAMRRGTRSHTEPQQMTTYRYISKIYGPYFRSDKWGRIDDSYEQRAWVRGALT
jgi:hypothetical protein